MPVRSDAEDLNIDASRFADLVFVGDALLCDFGTDGQAARDVRSRGIYIDMGKEVRPHERVVGRGMAWCEPEIFIEVERANVREVEAVFAMHSDEFFVEEKWSAPGCESEDGGGFVSDDSGDPFRGEGRSGGWVWTDENFHWCEINFR